jgi:hypothetical protein
MSEIKFYFLSEYEPYDASKCWSAAFQAAYTPWVYHQGNFFRNQTGVFLPPFQFDPPLKNVIEASCFFRKYVQQPKCTGQAGVGG